MAESLAHRWGQIIGDGFEMLVRNILGEVAQRHGLYLDFKRPRATRGGQGKVTWQDGYGNKHDLDYVLERGGTEDTRFTSARLRISSSVLKPRSPVRWHISTPHPSPLPGRGGEGGAVGVQRAVHHLERHGQPRRPAHGGLEGASPQAVFPHGQNRIEREKDNAPGVAGGDDSRHVRRCQSGYRHQVQLSPASLTRLRCHITLPP